MPGDQKPVKSVCAVVPPQLCFQIVCFPPPGFSPSVVWSIKTRPARFCDIVRKHPLSRYQRKLSRSVRLSVKLACVFACHKFAEASCRKQCRHLQSSSSIRNYIAVVIYLWNVNRGAQSGGLPVAAACSAQAAFKSRTEWSAQRQRVKHDGSKGTKKGGKRGMREQGMTRSDASPRWQQGWRRPCAL